MVFVCITVCCFAENSRSHRVEGGDPIEALQNGDVFYWQILGPTAFLDFLKARDTIYYVHGLHYGWIQESDIPALAKLIHSKVPCAPVVRTSCCVSFPEKTRSTVGQEALFLIDGFREGVYPPSATSIGYAKTDKQAIMNWLKGREKRK